MAWLNKQKRKTSFKRALMESFTGRRAKTPGVKTRFKIPNVPQDLVNLHLFANPGIPTSLQSQLSSKSSGEIKNHWLNMRGDDSANVRTIPLIVTDEPFDMPNFNLS